MDDMPTSLAANHGELIADAVFEMVDTAGMPEATCALLTPAIKNKLREMQPGQVLEVRVDDMTAREDIASWCRLAGHTLLGVIEGAPTHFRCFIRKKMV